MPLEKMVKISARVHKMLTIGTKDETFSDVIERAVQHYQSCPDELGQQQAK
jgi:hypothetical protein